MSTTRPFPSIIVPGSKAQNDVGEVISQGLLCAQLQTQGLIDAEYSLLNRENGPLGCPMSEELEVRDRPGRYQEFEYGSIAWSPQAGNGGGNPNGLLDA